MTLPGATGLTGGASAASGGGAKAQARAGDGPPAGMPEIRPWLWLAAAALLGTALVFARLRWLLPLGQALLAWPVLLRDLRRGAVALAAVHMLFWSLLVSVLTIEATIHFPGASEAAILRGAAYREEMFTWIRTGVGAEGTPRQFLPQHLLHYALTLALSLLTAGLAGLVLGAVLLNYMNYYVGCLVAEGARPLLGSIFGWPIWAEIRVAAFVLGAIAAADFGLARVMRRAPWRPEGTRRLMLWSVAFFLADLLIKALLAHPWRRILLRALLP